MSKHNTKLNVELRKNLLSQSKAQRLPTRSVIRMYQIQAQADNRTFDSYRWPKTSLLGLQANVPIFTGNRINSRVRQSNIQLQTSVLRLEDGTEKGTLIATCKTISAKRSNVFQFRNELYRPK
jgi:outer membrane protein TolC